MRAFALEYHDVVAGDDFDASGFPGAAAASYKLTVRQFDEHLAALASSYVPVSGIDVLARPPGGVIPVFLTFDDGGAGALTHALPLLDQRQWKGHFLIATGRIGSQGFLDRSQMVALHRAGHVIGSHSHSHPLRFSALSRREMLAEWTESKHAIDQILGAEVTVASIPGGQYRRVTADVAAEAGYRVLFTSEPVSTVRTVNGCMVVGRYSIRRSSSAAEAAALARGQGGVRERQWIVWNAKKVLKAAGGRTYLAVRERVFERRG